MKARLLACLFSISFFCYGQKPADLFNKLKISQSDTQKINTLNALTKLYLDINLDSASILNKQSLKIALSAGNEKYSYKSVYYKAVLFRRHKNFDSALVTIDKAFGIAKKHSSLKDQANAYHLMGAIYDQLNKNDQAEEYFNKSLSISKSVNDQKQLLATHLSLGIYYKRLTQTTQSLNHLLEAMKFAEITKDSSAMFTTCINLGSMYERTKDEEKAKKVYRKALIINQSEKDENDKAIVFFKLGKLFHTLKQIDSAKYYLTETMKIHEKLNDEVGMIMDYANLAGFNMEEKDYVTAEKNYMKALELGHKDNDSNKLNMLYSYLGGLYRIQKKNDKALQYYKTSISYINETVPKETITMEYKRMAEIYYEMGNYKEAYNSYVKHKAWSDSVYNVADTKKQTELKLNYEFDQTQKRIEAENHAKELISQAELENERKQRNYLLLGLGIISLLLIVTIKNYKAKQKANHILQRQKREIEHQKRLVEEKNNEINDSINYAQRIQTATIPKTIELDNYFKNYDIFFKPKDVVSGDFYWTSSSRAPYAEGFSKDFSIIAIADCTGHGVPGAITSMIGSMLLNEIFYVKKMSQPDEVLTELNRLVKLTLRQESDITSNDGMDIAFCLLNNSTNELLYAGANRPLYVINENTGLTEYKPTKVSVGGQVPLIQKYELHKIQLNKGDTVVISTDGYADQFGGAKEKKFTTKAFRNLLIDICSLSVKDQKQKIENTFNNWKGNHIQTDDILVFILKV